MSGSIKSKPKLTLCTVLDKLLLDASRSFTFFNKLAFDEMSPMTFDLSSAFEDMSSSTFDVSIAFDNLSARISLAIFSFTPSNSCRSDSISCGAAGGRGLELVRRPIPCGFEGTDCG